MEALSTLGHFLLTLVVGMFVLTVLVYVHELGHYLVAKRCGMGVKAFAIFMGGVLQTDLKPYLPKPLAPVKLVWAAFAAGVALAMSGALMGVQPLYIAGLAGAGIAVPVWAMLRLAALYHVPSGRVLSTLVKAVAVGVVVLALGTKFRGIDAAMVVGVLSGAALVALGFTYYLPVQMRQEDDDRQGFGQIEVPGVDGNVPVRFRPVWHRMGKNGTEFSLLLLPLGGFALIEGMHPKADGSEVNIPGGFYSKPPHKRLAALFAGPLFSVLFGFFLLVGLYSTVGKEVADTRPIVGGVGEGSGAEKAGIKPGDEILTIEGAAVKDFHHLTQLMRDRWVAKGGKNQPLPTRVEYRRDGKTVATTVVPTVDKKPEPLRDENMEPLEEKAIQARLGVLAGTKFESLSFVEATAEASMAPIAMVKGLVGIFIKPATAAENVGGPTMMAKVTSAAVESGPYYVVWFAAVLSISLGVMNLLPIVPLDGGQMVVAFVEMLRGGKRLSITVQNRLANSGLALIVLLMLAVFAVDLGRSAEANQKRSKDEAAVTQPSPTPSDGGVE